MVVELGLAKSFKWSFTIADVSKPILGADFLRHYGLLVDLKCKRLMDAETFLQSLLRTGVPQCLNYVCWLRMMAFLTF